jgi:hypothetical protein
MDKYVALVGSVMEDSALVSILLVLAFAVLFVVVEVVRRCIKYKLQFLFKLKFFL